MCADPVNHPLSEWNRLNKANTENALVTAMLRSMLPASRSLESYSNWVAAGCAGAIVLLVGHINDIVPIMGRSGFAHVTGWLLASCFVGAVAKFLAVMCQNAEQAYASVVDAIGAALEKFHADREKIETLAGRQGISLHTEINLTDVVSKYLSLFPGLIRWIVSRHLAKHATDPHVAFILPIRILRWQGMAISIQVIWALVAVVFAIACTNAAE